ncbi:hypothetical protein [Jiella mangrovi]|uniref:N-acetyltransferase domain-containing protein n=1 Tax=Jiella mangrovi TaxID=2821407 RepID=A0ABS4BFG5_9HYPH|nr:hypothetical protein [Jiella mangrovi]MBP0615497.1 hypothetical protein [Jiella mangrovi]
MEPRPGRKAFKGFAPKGYRIRMMEPGEAEALFRLRMACLPAAGEIKRQSLADFVTHLVSHEIFVAADKRTGAIAGFAAAGDRIDFYFVSEIRIDPRLAARGIDAALIDAVTQRARWFYHRAIVVSPALDSGHESSSYDQRGFMKVSRKDFPLNSCEDLFAGTGFEALSADRHFRVKWL